MEKPDILAIPGVLCRHETREVDVPLTPEEWAARSEEMALTLERVRLHEEYAAQVRKFLASEKEKINHELQKLGSAVTRHAEPREMPVAVFVDVATGRTLIVRDVDMNTTPPTGLVHSVKAATPDDLADANRIRQMPLGLPGQGQNRLRVVSPTVGAPPTMPDLGGATGATAGEKVVVLSAYNGSNQIRGTAALANAFKLPVTECRKLLHALSLGVQVIGGRLSGAQLTMGVDQLRMAEFSLEIEDPVEVPDVEVEVELTDAGENRAAVVYTLFLMLGLDDFTANRLVAGAPTVITRMPLVKAAELVAMIRSAKGRAKVLDEPQVDEGEGDTADEGEPQAPQGADEGEPQAPAPTPAPEASKPPQGADWPYGWVHVSDFGEGKMGTATAALRDLGFARAKARAILDKIDGAGNEKVAVYCNRPPEARELAEDPTICYGDANIHEVVEKLRAAGMTATAVPWARS